MDDATKVGLVLFCLIVVVMPILTTGFALMFATEFARRREHRRLQELIDNMDRERAAVVGWQAGQTSCVLPFNRRANPLITYRGNDDGRFD